MTSMDRIVSVEPGMRAHAVRHLPSTLDAFATHFPRFPVQPGVLLLDDMVEVARLAIGRDWVLVSANRVRYRGFARPGDEVDIEVDVIMTDNDTAYCRAVARVVDEQVATARELVLRPVERSKVR